MGRYPKFVKKLLDSPSKEVRFLSRVLLSDRRSQINKNVYYLSSVTSVNILEYPLYKYKQLLPRKSVPVSDQWRLGLLSALLNARKSKNFFSLNLNKSQCQDMIDSLCSSQIIPHLETILIYMFAINHYNNILVSGLWGFYSRLREPDIILSQA